MATQPPAITPQAISDGDPEALAALCAQRGSSVLAYCDHVAAPQQASAAAADALGRLRAEVFDACQAASAIDIEALLMTAMRSAATAHGVVSTDSLRDSAFHCSGRESALIAQLEQSLEPAESLKLDEHVSGCAACSHVSRRLEAGRRAFDSPPRAPLPPRVTEQFIAALVAAAPLTALGGDADAVRTQLAQKLEELFDHSSRESLSSSGAETVAPANGPPASAPMASAPEPSAREEPEPAALPGQMAASQADVASAPASPAPHTRSETHGAGSAQPPAHGASRPRASYSHRSSRRRHPAPAESSTLRALISDTYAAARNPAPGPRRTTTDGHSHTRMPGSGGLEGRTIAQRQSPATVQGRSAELAAVALFMLVASTVALVTFLIVS